MKLHLIPLMGIIAILMTACGNQTTHQTEGMADEELARVALIDFFAYLHAGEYENAVDLYGGSYSVMIDQNPDIDPGDHAALFRAACRMNGAQCLQVVKATWEHDSQVPKDVSISRLSLLVKMDQSFHWEHAAGRRTTKD